MRKFVALLGLLTLLAGCLAGGLTVKLAEAKFTQQPVAIVATVMTGHIDAVVGQIAPLSARPYTNPLLELIYFLLSFFHRPV